MDIRFALIALVHVALVVVGGALIVIDARTHRLPDLIVLPTLASLAALTAVDALLTGRGDALLRALLGLVILGGFYAVLRAISRAGMGGGDVKLAAVIGLVLGWHGWDSLVIGAAAAFVLGAFYALALILLRRATGATRIAFGPWMIAGALLGIVLG
ncbi:MULTISPECIES: prepilin peptidase [Microbacterium]|uniref:A24 family peptidase n=1 Tax=Microbacterium aurugineum TaxID=2851642 RepID=A0ABY4IX69_9MICO|nr:MULTISPECIES: A24 family peptidase [Microbacterium]MCK8465613.1 A24 family peptidase [Microbacterium aurugineum]PKQ35156.1 MAG: prepilin peptidase [Actinobacteria bacterium HGW-Actinobacteria-11]UPL17357.1 A24 family peptidase [Microbacterium aurugineum]